MPVPVRALILFTPNIDFSMKENIFGKFNRSKSLGRFVVVKLMYDVLCFLHMKDHVDVGKHDPKE